MDTATFAAPRRLLFIRNHVDLILKWASKSPVTDRQSHPRRRAHHHSELRSALAGS